MSDLFQEHKDEILEAVNKTAPRAGLTGPLNIVDGIVFNEIQTDTKKYVVGGTRRIPMIAVVDGTGRIHHFALKTLLPNINL